MYALHEPAPYLHRQVLSLAGFLAVADTKDDVGATRQLMAPVAEAAIERALK